MRSIGGTVYMSKKTGFQGSAKHKTLNTPSLMGPKRQTELSNLRMDNLENFKFQMKKKNMKI